MENIIIKCNPMVFNCTPYGFHRYAKQFLEVAPEAKDADGFTPVPYYIYCRAIELGLKSFLLLKKVSVKNLKKEFGHNLFKLLRKAIALEIKEYVKVSEKHINEVKKANKNYAAKEFEYFQAINAVKGYRKLPDLNILSEFAVLLVDALEEPCLNA